ncbi:MAG: sulfotransferase domain-containing protein, partial [Gammaproteobacteria bacterium]
YIARDGRDTLWSWYNHHRGFSDTAFKLFNETPGRVGPPLEPAGDDIVAYFHAWLERDGFPIWPYFSHVQSWWDIRELPNIMLLHFNELKADLPGKIREIAKFLEIDIDEQLFPKMVEHASFDYMKKNANDLTPLLSEVFDKGASYFINKGSNARWNEVLSEADIKKYQEVASQKLSPACAAWLESGHV